MRRRRATALLWEKGSKTTHHPGIRNLHKAHETVEGSELVWGTVEYQCGSNYFWQLVSERDDRSVVSQIRRREEVNQLGRDGMRGRIECYPCPSRLRKAGTGQPRKWIASFQPSTARNGGLDCGVLLRGAWMLSTGECAIVGRRVDDSAMVVAGVWEERRATKGE
jgi:hypothetical protein